MKNENDNGDEVKIQTKLVVESDTKDPKEA